MNYIISIGPLAIDATIAVLIASYFLVQFIGRLVGKKWPDHAQWIMDSVDFVFIGGLIGARLGYVLANWSAYVSEPWVAFYFWQPGYSWLGGGIAGTAVLGYQLATSSKEFRKLRSSVAFSIIAVFAILNSLAANLLTTNPENLTLPEFRLTTLEGKPFDSRIQLERTPAVINFWATWCGPCRREMPLIQEIQNIYADQVTVLALNQSEDIDVVKNYIEKNNLSLNVLVDGPDSGNRIFNSINGQVLPTTLFIDAGGVIQSVHTGELSRATFLEGIHKITE